MKFILLTMLIILKLSGNEIKNIDDMETFGKTLSEQLAKFEITELKNKIKAEIKIDINGNFDYKILNKSNIIDFDNKLKEFLEEQKKIKFPTYKNKEFRTIVTFTAEIKN